MKIIIDGTPEETRAFLTGGGGSSMSALADAAGEGENRLNAGQVGEEVRELYRSFAGARQQATREIRAAAAGGKGVAAAGATAVQGETRGILESAVGEGYTLVDPAGNLLERGDMLQDITTHATDFEVERSEEVMKTFGGHTAIWVSLIDMKGVVNGRDFSGRYRDVETFAKDRGEWRLVHSNLTPITGGQQGTRRR
ncbi:MAG TPA: hypothetical protein VF613_24860 [Longimicrobium sp.]|jgi:hypothetical protein